MSDNNEFDPQIEASIRDIPAADLSLREQHIAAALNEMAAPETGNGRLRFLSAAAAVLILVAVGVGISKNSGDTPPAIAADTSTTSVPKASGECTHSGGFWGDVGSVEKFTFGDTAYELVLRNGTVEVLLGTSPCTTVDTIVYYEEMRRRDNQEELPSKTTCEQKTLVQFSDNSGGPEYALALLETSDGVSLFFEDRCNEPLGSIPLPASGD